MAVAVNSETGYERQNLPEPTDCLWILQPSHVTRSHKNANVKRYAVATLPRTDGVIAHKWHTTRTGKPGRSAQTYFSFPSPAPLPNAHAHEEKLPAGLLDYGSPLPEVFTGPSSERVGTVRERVVRAILALINLPEPFPHA